MPMMRSRHRPFTLLEILIALAILGIAATVVGWQIGKSVRIYRFQHEVEELHLAMKRAQVLALTHQTDLRLHIDKQGDKFVYYVETDEPFPDNLIDQRYHTIKEIEKIHLQDKPVEHLDLTFYSQGNIEPRSTLELFSRDSSSRWLDFQGAFLLKLCVSKPQPMKEHSPAFPALKTVKKD